MAFPAASYAAQPILFTHTPSARDLARVLQALPALAAHSSLHFAEVDLNEDGIHELIARPSDCPEDGSCAYEIMADTPKGFVSIGSIKGRKLHLANDYTKGVRNLLALDNPANDYAYSPYVWDSAQSRYVSGKAGEK